MVSLVSLAVLSAGASPVSSEPSEGDGAQPVVEDPCLARRAVRACAGLQLAVHTERGSFDAFLFSMHHPQAGVFWFQEPESGEFLRVSAPRDADTTFLGAGWTAITADGVAYRSERVLRETYVLRRVEADEPIASN